MTQPTKRRPVSTWVYASNTGWLFIFLFHLIDPKVSEPHWHAYLDVVMVGLLAAVWPFLTLRRIEDFGWSKWLLSLFALPWVAFVAANFWGNRWACLSTLLVLLAAQSILVFRSAPRAAEI
jgi:uncharacterized membrane protein YhaH (DUF805 family)